MATGWVVVLNGTTSAGTSTLAAGLHRSLAAEGTCSVVMALDDAFARLPPAWFRIGDHVGAHAEDGIAFEQVDGAIERRVGPVGTQVLAAYRAAVGATARAGLNVIVDEVLLSAEDWIGWLQALDGLDVLWVRVDCRLDVATAREEARGDRVLGMAAAQIDVVHRHPTYGATVDTAALDLDEALAALLAAVGPFVAGATASVAGALRLGLTAVNAVDLPLMTRFWQAALGGVVRGEVTPDRAWVTIEGTGVAIQRSPGEARPVGRLHLDLVAADQQAEVARLLSLGATFVRHEVEPGDDFVVLEDPEGNPFCVVQRPLLPDRPPPGA